jgi:hypothetical protein
METRKLFLLIWRGWFTFTTVVFTPIFLLSCLFVPGVSKEMLIAVPIIPIVAAMQGAILAAVILLGLKIWPIKS